MKSIERVFISSTVYDLIDARSEIELILRESGITPVMSESKLDGFKIESDVNSIETCLSNVRSCDAVIVLLSQRYGPKLGKYNFEDVSATHLEYIEAKKNGLPIFFYIRSSLEADYSIWKKNGCKEDFQPVWGDSLDLLKFIQNHKKLVEGGINNWYQTFSNSVDLKKLILKDFEKTLTINSLHQRIKQNNIPIFTAEIKGEVGNDFDQFTGRPLSVTFTITVKNIGTFPAYNVTIKDSDSELDSTPVIAPTSLKSFTSRGPFSKLPYADNLIITYTDLQGVEYTDKFLINAQGLFHINAIDMHIRMIDREYRIIKTGTLIIKNDTSV